MLRLENIVCGTSTTGTGTLTLAATPAAIGAIDPFVAFSGLGLGTSQATPLPYVIIEYTDNTFVTPKQLEKGFGALLLGASIAATTLARTPVISQVIATPANNVGTVASPATPITIGTAANVLVFIGPSAWDQAQALHAYSTSGILSGAGLGVSPWSVGSTIANISMTSGRVEYYAIRLEISDVIKSCSIRLTTAVTTPTTSSVALALYAIGSTGLPGKKLIDFGTVSGANPLSTGNSTLTATAAAGVPIMAGHYILGVLPIWTGGTGNPVFEGGACVAPSPFGPSFGNFFGNLSRCTVSGQSSLTDPATTTSITAQVGAATQQALSCAFRNT